MSKAKSRAIPYRVYKKMFADCNAYDYHDGKITVDFPADYLASKMYTPEGWIAGSNYVSSRIGRTISGREVRAEVAEHSDGGCKYYDAVVTVGNTFFGGSMRTREFIRSFDAAIAWAVETAESFLK